ncbi:response regulator transcription factor [Pseudomonas sp. Ant30-3]|uniref:response regulator transcription factor n=1 Tax=Pseudomonas sp. Ant30-3 TaxID=1488328 RepID=UPI000518414E|nr:response regulator transcription factor [Pseudomonas sp. Ant30-3]
MEALVVDDHPVVRAAVAMLLRKAGFLHIHEASTGSEVLPKIREHKPDLVVLDLVMPGLDGLDVLARIRASGMKCRVLVFTSQEPLHYQDRCMRAGAEAYVSKTNNLDHLQKAMGAVMAGYSYFVKLPSSSVALNALQRTEAQMIERLSDRELTIFQCLSQGMSNKDIGKRLNLSHKTISTYKVRLIEKLHVKSGVFLRDIAKRNHVI